MAKRIKIEGVTELKQPGGTLLRFALNGEQLLEWGRVVRFSDDTRSGVQRNEDEEHTARIANAMRSGKVLFAEAFVVTLEGDWKFSARSGTLTCQAGGFLAVDDGQHRRAGLEQQEPAWARQFNFDVVSMPIEATYEDRLNAFVQKNQALAVDTTLELAQRAKANNWDSELQQRAYAICMALHQDGDSPLQGRVVTYGNEQGPQEPRIGLKGLFNIIVRVIGGSSPLEQLPLDRQTNVIKGLMRAASDVWPAEWGKSVEGKRKVPLVIVKQRYMLITTKGIEALLLLLVASSEFRTATRGDLREATLRGVLERLQTYRWTRSNHRNVPSSDVVRRLNERLAKIANAELGEVKTD